MTGFRWRRLLRRSYYHIKDYPLYRILEQLEMSEQFSRAEMEELQSEKLRQLIRHAYDTVPYYREQMDSLRLQPCDIRRPADLQKLPVLTRSDVRKHHARLLSSSNNPRRLIWCRTGGSTGTPLKVANDTRGLVWSNACYFRGLGWAGYDMDRDRLGLLFGGSLDAARDRGRGRRKRASLALSLPAYDLDSSTVQQYWSELAAFQPDFLKSYSSIAYKLVHSLRAAGLPAFPLKGIFTTSEYQPPHWRREIEEFFATRVFDYYGSVEVNSLGFQCEANSQGYHIPEEHAIVETVRDNLLPGEQSGPFLVTDLDNLAMPLIRYENGDAGELTSQICQCGRPLQRINRLHGRCSGFLQATDGTMVSGGIVDYVFGETQGISEFSLIQELEDLCRLILVRESFRDDIQGLIDTLRQFLGSDMRFEIEEVNEIPRTAAGKRNFTMNRLSSRGLEPDPSDASPGRGINQPN